MNNGVSNPTASVVGCRLGWTNTVVPRRFNSAISSSNCGSPRNLPSVLPSSTIPSAFSTSSAWIASAQAASVNGIGSTANEPNRPGYFTPISAENSLQARASDTAASRLSK